MSQEASIAKERSKLPQLISIQHECTETTPPKHMHKREICMPESMLQSHLQVLERVIECIDGLEVLPTASTLQSTWLSTLFTCHKRALLQQHDFDRS